MTAEFSPETASRAQVLERIVDEIVAGNVAIGKDNRTSEEQVSRLLGFKSRTPIVREALALLSRDGIVAQRPQWGHWVPPVSVEEARESLRFRAGIEEIVAAELASQAEQRALGTLRDKLDEMQGMLDEMEMSTDEAVGQDFLRKDALYRSEMARMGGFVTAFSTIRMWSDKLRIFRSPQNLELIDVHFPVYASEMEATILGHEAILERIEDQDRDGAATGVEKHMEDALLRLEIARTGLFMKSSWRLEPIPSEEGVLVAACAFVPGSKTHELEAITGISSWGQRAGQPLVPVEIKVEESPTGELVSLGLQPQATAGSIPVRFYRGEESTKTEFVWEDMLSVDRPQVTTELEHSLLSDGVWVELGD